MRISDWSSDVCSSDLIALKTAISHRPPYLIIQGVLQVRRPGVCIPGIPTVKKYFPYIRPVIPVGIFKEKEIRRLRYDQSSVCKYQTGRDVQAVGKYSEFIGSSVTIRIFTNSQKVITNTRLFHHLIWINLFFN